MMKQPLHFGSQKINARNLTEATQIITVVEKKLRPSCYEEPRTK